MVGCRYGMDFVGRRDHFLLEQRVRIVFAPLQFRDNDSSLRFAIFGIVETVAHPLGLDEQHAVESGCRRGFHVSGLVDPRVSVPAASEFFDDALDLIAGDIGRALEVHVLDPMRHTGEAGHLVFRTLLCTSTKPTQAGRCAPLRSALSARCPGQPMSYRCPLYRPSLSRTREANALDLNEISDFQSLNCGKDVALLDAGLSDDTSAGGTSCKNTSSFPFWWEYSR